MSSVFSRAADLLGHVFTPERARGSNETPAYDVASTEEDIEIRDYAPMVVAETVCTGEREDAETEGFKRLYDFIRGKDREGEEIEMTTPVFQLPNYGPITAEALSRSGGETVVRFAMPSQFTKASLPRPADPLVHIGEVPARRVAALRFSGTADDEEVAKRTVQLQNYLSRAGLTPSGKVEFAIYDPPFTPPPARRNEILIPV